MTKTELLKKITDSQNISENEQMIFLEIFLQRCSELLNDDESITIENLGKFSYNKSDNVNQVVFISNENEKLLFDIPKSEKETLPIDSYFSISIGKPVIPFKDFSEEENFIYSDSDRKKILQLKVEKFIQDASQTETEAVDDSSDIAGIQFSILNWKKSSNLNDDINIEEDDEFEESKNESEESIEAETLLNEMNDKNEESIPEDFEETIHEEINIDETETSDIKEIIDEGVLLESTEMVSDDLLEELKIDNDTSGEIKTGDAFNNFSVEKNDFEVSEFLKEKNEKAQIYFEEKTIVIDEDSSAIKEAFKYVDEKQTRINNLNKKSYTGIIFAAIIIISVAVIIYLTYYNGVNETPSVLNSSEPNAFKVVIERSYEIPVSYPYQSGMFAGIYDALNNDLFKSADNQLNLEQSNESAGNKKVPEIKSPSSSKRIKNYIYKYDDGTFALQISSWKSKTVAISETQNFLDKGYGAFIEETGINDKIYRVRIGGFKSLEKAEKFSKNTN